MDRDIHCDKCDILFYFMYSKTGINFVLEKIFNVLGLVYKTLTQKNTNTINTVQFICKWSSLA